MRCRHGLEIWQECGRCGRYSRPTFDRAARPWEGELFGIVVAVVLIVALLWLY